MSVLRSVSTHYPEVRLVNEILMVGNFTGPSDCSSNTFVLGYSARTSLDTDGLSDRICDWFQYAAGVDIDSGQPL